MEEYGIYNITEQFNYNELYVSIVIKKNVNISNIMAKTIAEKGCSLILNKNGFIVEDVFEEDSYIISDKDKELYEFEVYIKDMPTEKHYKKVDWNITEVYEMLKKQYPSKNTFKWDCISYGIEEINS